MPASSTYYSILTAVQTQIQTIVSNCVVRRRLLYLESDALPIVYVAPDLPEGESIIGNNFIGPDGNKTATYAYPVWVCYVQAGAPDLSTGLDVFLNIRQQIKTLLYQPLLSGVAQVWDIEIDPDSTSRFQEFVSKDFDVSAWRITYHTTEVRD
jgi:hypothetical protein